MKIINYIGFIIWIVLAAFVAKEINDIVLFCAFSIICLILGVTCTILDEIKKDN